MGGCRRVGSAVFAYAFWLAFHLEIALHGLTIGRLDPAYDTMARSEMLVDPHTAFPTTRRAFALTRSGKKLVLVLAGPFRPRHTIEPILHIRSNKVEDPR